jgi:predicted nucleotidyltransferase
LSSTLRIQEEYAEYISGVVGELKRDDSVVAVAVFGSVVKTSRRPNDIDILVVFKDRVNRELLDSIREKYRDPPLHFFPRTLSDLNVFSTLWLEIYFRGVVLYDRDGALMSRLEKWRRRVEELTGSELSSYPAVIWFRSRVDPEQLTLE